MTFVQPVEPSADLGDPCPGESPLEAEFHLSATPRGDSTDSVGYRLRSLSPVAATVLVAVFGWLCLAAIIVGAAALFDVLDPTRLEHWDRSAVRWFEDARRPWLTDLSTAGTWLADKLVVVGLGAVLLVVLAAKKLWQPFGVLFLSLVAEATLYYAVTLAVPRSRPAVEQLENLRPDASYPSGHSAAAFALYFSIAVAVTCLTCNRLVRFTAWAVVVCAPIIVAVSRVYRGMHHPTDVIAGYAMGAGCVIIALVATQVGAAVRTARLASRPPLDPDALATTMATPTNLDRS